MAADQTIPLSRCGYCGSTNYRKVVERDSQGVMRYGQRLVCSGCVREFSNTEAWRQGQDDAASSRPTAT